MTVIPPLSSIMNLGNSTFELVSGSCRKSLRGEPVGVLFLLRESRQWFQSSAAAAAGRGGLK
jgi:hypothetical protein